MTLIFIGYLVCGITFIAILSIKEIIGKVWGKKKEEDDNGERADLYLALFIALIIIGFMRYRSNETVHSELKDLGYYKFTAVSYDIDVTTSSGRRSRATRYDYTVKFAVTVKGYNYYYFQEVDSDEEAQDAVDMQWRVERRIFKDKEGNIYYGEEGDTAKSFTFKNKKWIKNYIIFAGISFAMFIFLKVRSSIKSKKFSNKE